MFKLTSDSYVVVLAVDNTPSISVKVDHKPLRRLIVDGDRETTTGPRFSGSGLPQFIAKGAIPICFGYVLNVCKLFISQTRVERGVYLRKNNARCQVRSKAWS